MGRGGVSASPIGVLFLTDLLEMGGAETQLIELAHALDANRFRPIVGLLRGEGELSSHLRIPIVRYLMPCAYDPRVVPRLIRTIRHEQIGVIYTTHVRSALLARMARKIVRPTTGQRRLVVVTSEHSHARPSARPFPNRLRRRTAGLSDRIIAITEVQATRLRDELRIDPERVLVIPNGIDPERFAELPDAEPVRREFGIRSGETVFACIARLEPVKDLTTLLAAMEKVEGHLIIVGDGSQREALEEMARTPALIGRVHFAMTRTDVRPVLSAANAVCLSSTDESQPIALLEAMAAGRPVVATAVGGIPEIIEDGETGLLVAPADPAAYSAALQRVAADHAWRQRAGEAARIHVARTFSIHERARRIEALFDELIEESMR